MTDRINEIRERVEKATPGPWVAMADLSPSREDHGWRKICTTLKNNARNVFTRSAKFTPEKGRSFGTDEDSDFIAHAREDIPFLLSEIDRLKKELADEVEWRKGKDDTATIFMHQVKKLQLEQDQLREALRDVRKKCLSSTQADCPCEFCELAKRIDALLWKGANGLS